MYARQIIATFVAVLMISMALPQSATASFFPTFNQGASITPGSTAMQSAATSNGNGTAMTATGYATGLIAVSGTFSATVNFECSQDNSTWVPIIGVAEGSTTAGTSTTSTGNYLFNVSGINYIRARISGYSSGSVTATGYCSVVSGGVSGGGGSGGSSNITQWNGNTVSTGNGTTGSGSLRVTVSSDSTGNIATIGTSVTPGTASANLGKATNSSAGTSDTGVAALWMRNDGDASYASSNESYTPPSTDYRGVPKVVLDNYPTYSACSAFISPPSSATDVATIYYGGSNIIEILRIEAVTYNSTGTLAQFSYLLERSSADSGGTSSTVTAVPHDPNSSAAGAVVSVYTANPTSLGTLVGTLNTLGVTSMLGVTSDSSYPVSSPAVLFDAQVAGQPLFLRSSGQGIVVNYNGTTLSGSSPKVAFRFIWRERPH